MSQDRPCCPVLPPPLPFQTVSDLVAPSFRYPNLPQTALAGGVSS